MEYFISEGKLHYSLERLTNEVISISYPPRGYEAEPWGCRAPAARWSKGVSWPRTLCRLADLLRRRCGRTWPPRPGPTRSYRQSGKIPGSPEHTETDGWPDKEKTQKHLEKIRETHFTFTSVFQGRACYVYYVFSLNCLRRVMSWRSFWS